MSWTSFEFYERGSKVIRILRCTTLGPSFLALVVSFAYRKLGPESFRESRDGAEVLNEIFTRPEAQEIVQGLYEA
jgi:hypothetical protein